MKNNSLKTIGGVTLLLAISAALQFSTPNIADPDSFYHLAHAKIYAERGIFYAEFPWAQFSVIKDLKADLWYGFHLFLIPFTYIGDGILGIKIAGAVITFLTLAGFYWVLARLKIKWPLVWVLIFVVAAPDVMYRLTMTRPHNLTLALALIVFALVLTGGKRSAFLILGFFSSFLHIALGWLPIFVAALSNLILKTRREPVRWANLIYLAAGSAIGILARPHPLGALKLAYIQVVQIIFIKLQNIPLTFGRELKPPTWDMFLRNTPLIILILATALVLYKMSAAKNNQEAKEQKNIFWAALAISGIFFLVTTLVARRSYDIFIGLGLVAAAAALTLYLKNSAAARENSALSVLIIVIGLLSFNSVTLFKKYNDGAWIPTHLKESSLWLKENSKPGEIVFHTNWDQFGALFFWNQNNYYINGMDPVFQYAYNEPLYWKNHFMFTTDSAYSQTCGKIRCTAEEVESTAKVLANDFKASYVVLRKAQNPKTYFFWLKEKTFPLVFENAKEAVFKIPHL